MSYSFNDVNLKCDLSRQAHCSIPVSQDCDSGVTPKLVTHSVFLQFSAVLFWWACAHCSLRVLEADLIIPYVVFCCCSPSAMCCMFLVAFLLYQSVTEWLLSHLWSLADTLIPPEISDIGSGEHSGLVVSTFGVGGLIPASALWTPWVRMFSPCFGGFLPESRLIGILKLFLLCECVWEIILW